MVSLSRESAVTRANRISHGKKVIFRVERLVSRVTAPVVSCLT